LLGSGTGAFRPTSPTGGVARRSTPLAADFDGDGVPDSIALDSSGNILFRMGMRGDVHHLAPSVVLNPGRPARDLAAVRPGAGWAVAAADQAADPALSSFALRPVFTVSLYTLTAGGAVTRTTALRMSLLPTRLAAADLTGGGRDDLVVAH